VSAEDSFIFRVLIYDLLTLLTDSLTFIILELTKGSGTEDKSFAEKSGN